MSAVQEHNVTGTRTEIIVSPGCSRNPGGRSHAPKKDLWGRYVRRMDWRVTACGQIADALWSQRRQYGYVDCRNCIAALERSA